MGWLGSAVNVLRIVINLLQSLWLPISTVPSTDEVWKDILRLFEFSLLAGMFQTKLVSPSSPQILSAISKE